MEALLAIFRALGDPSRLRILLLLRGLDLAVGEIARVLQQSQPRVSRHLRILAEAGLVERVKEGAWVFVRLGPAAVTGPVLAAIDALAGPELAAADIEQLAAVRAERRAAVAAWFNEHAAQWEQERSLHSREAGVEAAIVAALGGSATGDLVDIGTGTGRMIELLGPASRSAIGIDRSPEMLRVARSRLEAAGLAAKIPSGVRVQAGDMYAVPLPDACADTVVLHQVLHYADDPAAVLAEAARLLRGGGRLLVVDLMPHEREELRDERRHQRLGFAEEAVLGWLAAAGLAGAVAARLPGETADQLGVTMWIGEAR